MAVTKKQPKRKTTVKKRLKRGRDWHAWAWKSIGHGGRVTFSTCEAYEYRPSWQPETRGKWVRVKFVEVPPRKRGD